MRISLLIGDTTAASCVDQCFFYDREKIFDTMRAPVKYFYSRKNHAACDSGTGRLP
jgi:hypothetical protein